jgi:5'-nucleotidase / UDP-sugar diphosphatase
MLRRAFAILVAILMLSSAALAADGRITLLQVNDVYEISPIRGRGGLAELSTLLKRERAANPNSITIVAGDFLSPSVMSGLTKGAQMIELFNAIGVDYVTFGNHEFDFGPEITRQRIADSKFKWLTANILGKDGKPFGGALAMDIRELSGIKVGLFGIITPEASHLSSPGPDVTFAPALEAAGAAVAELRRQGADLVVAVTHLDLADDRDLIRAVPGIDVVIGGHDHGPIAYYERNTLIHKAGQDAQFLAAIDLDIKTTTGSTGQMTTTVSPQWRMIANAGITPDPEIQPIVKKYNDRLDKELGVVIGTAGAELDSRTDMVRTGETRIGNLIAEAMMEHLGAEAAITNGGGIRGNRVIAANAQITRKDVFADLPFNTFVVLVEISGADLEAALENGVSQVENKAGRFPQVAGLRFEYDPKAPAGQRVTQVTVGNRPLDPARSYKVATNDFMANGGDGYAALTRGKVLTDERAAQLMATVVMTHIRQKGTVSPQLDGRVLAKR